MRLHVLFSTTKLPSLFFILKTKEQVLRVNKSNITGENKIEIIFGLKIAMMNYEVKYEVKTKLIFWGIFSNL